MRKCKFQLTRELQCGLETVGIMCPLHGLDEVRDSSINELEDYINKSLHVHDDILYLTNVAFHGLNWEIILGDYHRSIDFSGSNFEDCRFHSMRFSGPVDFTGTTFINTAFEGVEFLCGAEFTVARFDGKKTPFRWCAFKTNPWGGKGTNTRVSFERAIFSGSVTPFDACSFLGEGISFEEADFDCDRLQFHVHDQQMEIFVDRFFYISATKLVFTGIGFSGHLEYIQDPTSKSHAPRVDFQRVMFPQMKSVAFVEANLSKTRFTYSVIDNVNFIDCNWARKPQDKGRRVLFDDLSPVDDVSKWEVLRQYIQLKKNLENQRDFVGAGDWSYREMEWREKLAQKPLYKLGMWMYGFFADYGENSLKPFCWLVAVWLVAGLLYLFIGIPLGDGSSELNYDWGFDGVFQWGDIWYALKFSLVAMTLQLGKSIKLMDWCGTWAYVPHILMTVTLVPLFLLALRRKFRR